MRDQQTGVEDQIAFGRRSVGWARTELDETLLRKGGLALDVARCPGMAMGGVPKVDALNMYRRVPIGIEPDLGLMMTTGVLASADNSIRYYWTTPQVR